MTDFWTPVKLSLGVASFSLLIVFILGIAAAKFMANRTFKGRSVIDTVLLLPLVLPPSVVGFLLIVIFGRHSFIGQMVQFITGQPIIFTVTAAVIAATVVAFPLMYQATLAGFETINKDIENAARVDGAGELKVFGLITMPLASKAIISGGILSFARALGEFGATLMFAGNLPGRTQTIPTAIYMAMDSGNMTLAWQWVIVILFISFGMLMMVNFLKSKY
ncbi:molybdenum ABC transporter permease [Alkalihalobacillus alcalophilus ATCC 27647 = CGMCC 1.3604]|uniref:Molybdenum transport system permease n=1 Tax=Alkalihalobacillus alcalophilus ATCC 27647 = CGMCC 1.3604 TaxID=1218173 RepID=J8TLW7_ALKAL|nr:molybdate ABC transporter permease subunit [Alkalihalobacillus alcalophilus]AFV26005.1 molybdate transporter [Alkalihalobacillus alcalophilus ATCC 27647 = CGMCC 1.3604]KGA98168.1 molybdenum ABC transporter permease [Alkalihalobacillus alcalophilus ATCC 27647 = CGMCC 1.3604]MED1560837.1 molybdate ABC transporter permease subunit [Alkalihalobacillus alcalophilus]THG90542.1 molybdenum ABC transporter permease [Alkalihalobacillus alcalophilus ATCC 27647 = CGMCC 1.3604]